MKKIAIICGGPSSEYEVSLDTARSVYKHINKKQYEVWILHINKDGRVNLSEKEIERALREERFFNLSDIFSELKNFDMCFLATHGEFGEDGTLQTLLEYFGIKYTGTDSYASRLSMDKYRSTIIVKEGIQRIKIPKTILVRVKELTKISMKYPFVLKPNKKGSSVGVYIVKNQVEKEKAIEMIEKNFKSEEEYLIQEAILDSVEVSCGCLGKKDGKFLDIPAIEIIPQVGSFFDYESKYIKGGSIEIPPPKNLEESVSNNLTELAKEIHFLLGCSVYSRSDFLIKDKKIYYLETNTLPGMTSTSLLPQECEAMGMNFTELIDFIIQNS